MTVMKGAMCDDNDGKEGVLLSFFWRPLQWIWGYTGFMIQWGIRIRYVYTCCTVIKPISVQYQLRLYSFTA